MHFPLFPIPQLSPYSSTLPLLLPMPATNAQNLSRTTPDFVWGEGAAVPARQVD